MPKQPSSPVPEFDAQALVAKARAHSLRAGEAHALSVYITGLERSLRHRTDAQIAAARQHEVRLCLDEADAALIVTFPGADREHSVALPLAQGHLALDFLVKTLRERKGKTSFVGTKGAPTQADLAALAKASKAPAKRVGVFAGGLEDLGL